MKAKSRVPWIFVIVILVVAIGAIAIRSVTDTHGFSTRHQISQMAQYLNDKYGYSVSSDDCIYYREEDYSYHDGFLYGTTYDIPNIAIFDYNGKYITVTERNGFMGDDGQLKELNALICGYFEETIGLRPEFVEVWALSGEISYNRVLFQEYNQKLTLENIAEFMDCIWNCDAGYKMIFYFQEEENLTKQLDEITLKLDALKVHGNLESLRFYVTDMEELNIYYKTPSVHLQSREENNREFDIGYICGIYHVVNDVEHHYPASSAAVVQITEFNSFLCGGYCVLGRGYGASFGSRQIQMVNNFGVVDLSDGMLDDYLKEMVSYGQYRGYTILFRAGEVPGVSQITIADGDKYRWQFRWGYGPLELYAFKNGNLLNLKTAYDCGYLSFADMDLILEKHKTHIAQNYSWDYDTLEPTDDAGKSLEFVYAINRKEYRAGDTVVIHAYVKNVGQGFEYIGAISDQFAHAKLSLKEGTQTYYFLSENPIGGTCDATGRTFETSESATYTYIFVIPDDAPLGTYALAFRVFGLTAEFEEAIVIVE